MKFVGFILEEDKNIFNAKPLKDMFLVTPNPVGDRVEITEYLNKGVFLTGVMSHIYDKDGLPIGNMDYFTDGGFIWPIYYKYHMEKYDNFYIDEGLLSFARSRGFIVPEIEKSRIMELESLFETNWVRIKRG